MTILIDSRSKISRNSIFSFVKGFFGRLFFILKGGDPWLNEPIKNEKETKDSIILTDPNPYLYLDE